MWIAGESRAKGRRQAQPDAAQCEPILRLLAQRGRIFIEMVAAQLRAQGRRERRPQFAQPAPLRPFIFPVSGRRIEIIFRQFREVVGLHARPQILRLNPALERPLQLAIVRIEAIAAKLLLQRFREQRPHFFQGRRMFAVILFGMRVRLLRGRIDDHLAHDADDRAPVVDVGRAQFVRVGRNDRQEDFAPRERIGGRRRNARAAFEHGDGRLRGEE